jgi:SPP1 gp7 family putative phage head morphogenesis protein
MSKAEIVAAIRLRRAGLKLLGKLPRRRRPPPQLQPDAIRTAYFGAVLGALGRAREIVRERLEPELAALAAEAQNGRGDGIRTDKDPASVNDLIDGISDAWFEEFPNERLARTAEKFATRTAKFQREQLSKQFKAVAGIDVVQAEPWLGPKVKAFTAENVALIKSVASDHFADIEKRLGAGLSRGERWEDLAKTIGDRYEVAASRAKLIARDQVGKLYGDLNRTRQTQLGVTSFVWRTMKDNRVRDEHAALDGETFAWTDPPEDGIPGEAVNCRCWGEPVMDEIAPMEATAGGELPPSPPSEPPGGGGEGGEPPGGGGGEGSFPEPRFHGEEPPADGPQPYWRMELGPPGKIVDLGGARRKGDQTLIAAETLRKRGNDVFLLPEKHVVAMYDAAVNPPGGDTALHPVELTRIAKRGADAKTVKRRIEKKAEREQGADQLVVDASLSNLSAREAARGVERATKNLKGYFRFIRIIGPDFDLTFSSQVPRI